jgi:hypothetical protein
MHLQVSALGCMLIAGLLRVVAFVCVCLIESLAFVVCDGWRWMVPGACRLARGSWGLTLSEIEVVTGIHPERESSSLCSHVRSHTQ